MMLRILVWASLLGVATAQCTEDKDCNIGGIIAGCILGTLAVCGIIALIVWLVQRKKNQASAARKSMSGGHDNKAMHDLEAPGTSAAAPVHGNANDFKRKGFGGYVPCHEYVSPTKNAKSVGANGSAGQFVYERSPDFPDQTRSARYLTKAGSHGSLDNGTLSMQQQGATVLVPLHSQDIIGLGFNISGNISDGIYVSQVHNRGPAKESGLITQGDRIMGVNISFENMVHEDALTILSYAAPYPVTLTLRKAAAAAASNKHASAAFLPLAAAPAEPSEGGGEDGGEYDAVVLTHPIYRSQSYDDVSKITPEAPKWIGPRRTWSEMKKGHQPMRQQASLEDDASGTLKKWGAQHNILYPDGSVMNDTSLHSGGGGGGGGAADLSLESAQGVDLDELQQQLEMKSEDMLDGLTDEDRLDMIRLSYEDPAQELQQQQQEFQTQVEHDGSVSYSATSTLEVRKRETNVGATTTTTTDLPMLPDGEELEDAARTRLPEDAELQQQLPDLQDNVELGDMKASLGEKVLEVQAALDAELPASTNIQVPQVQSSVNEAVSDVRVQSCVNEAVSDVHADIAAERATQVRANVQEAAPRLPELGALSGSVKDVDAAQASDVQINIPDILDQDNAALSVDIPDPANVDIEKVASGFEVPPAVSASVTVEKETGGFLSLLGFKRKRRGSSDSVSSFSSSASSNGGNGGKVDVNRNKGDAVDANFRIRPLSSDMATDIAFGAELQHLEDPTAEPSSEDIIIVQKVNGGGVLEHRQNSQREVEVKDVDEEVERSIESQLIMSEMRLAKRDPSNASMVVNTSDSVQENDDEDNNKNANVTESNDENGEENGEDEEEENMVRSVLKDYFGDKPSLLEQFGFDNEKEGSVMREGGVAFEINEADLAAASQPELEPEPRSKVKAKAKGGMSYFVTIDDEKNASLTDPCYYDPPISSRDDDDDNNDASTSKTTERAETPDLFASDVKLSDLSHLRLEAIGSKTAAESDA